MGVRVAEGAALEMLCTGNPRTAGSNPAPSAWQWKTIGTLRVGDGEPPQVRKEARISRTSYAGVSPVNIKIS